MTRIFSPTAEPGCLMFHYHMYGSSVGSLHVYSQASGATKRELWTKRGEQGSGWLDAQVEWPASNDTRVCRLLIYMEVKDKEIRSE
jgi:hypothetical protein